MTGQVSIEANGATIDQRSFPGRQGRLVFAYLLAEDGRPVPRDELAELLWGDTPPASWEKALSVLVSKLRVLLDGCGLDGREALRSAFGCYQLVLPPGAWIDVAAAGEAVDRGEAALLAGDLDEARAAAGEAASLARRGFLPGEDGTWIEGRRRELDEILVRAVGCLADASLAAGDTRQAARRAEELTALEPFRESGYRRLMEAHAAAGDRAEALRVYERCRRMLAEELGAYPSPETEALYRSLLSLPETETRADGQVEPAGPPDDHELVDAVPGVRTLSRRRVLQVGGAVLVLAAVATVSAVALDGDGAREVEVAAPNSVAVVDPATGRVRADIQVGTGPTAVTEAGGAIWVTNTAERSVTRIDPETGTVRQTVRVGDGPSGIASGGGAVWVANGLAGTVSRVDAATNEVVQTIPVGNSPAGVAFDSGAVWVTNADDRTVSKLDPATGEPEDIITVDAPARAIVAGGGALWVSDPASDVVVRLNPRSSAVTGRVSVGSGPTALAYGFRAIWVANNLDGTVSRIDAERGVVVDTIPVGIAPNGVAVAPDAVWVTDEAAGTIVRIDPTSGKTMRRPLGGRPKGAVYADGSLWVAVQADGAAHRGGTLRLLSSELTEFDLPDPARSYDELAWSLLTVTNDGLVAFKRVGGVEGTTLVPDLAKAIPAPTGGGRAYTFELRKGLRYSNGRPVKASDVRFSIERIFTTASPGLDFYGSIVGAPACAGAPARCNLSAGVVADDEAGTVTFRLRRPDADFLYKLALPFASLVPSGTPASAGHPVPATGPYRFARYDRGRLIRLTRNPWFRPWSTAAQPEGIPDVIELRNSAETDVLAAVQAGDGDIAGIPAGRLEEVRTRFPAQVHITPRAVTMLAQPNTTRPPFDSRAARIALALAIDRGRLARLASGSDVVRPTCQIFPPNFPGYRPYCLDTVDPERGVWSGPDLTRARELVRRSGTRGMRVDMIGTRDGLFAVAHQVVADALRQLGYRVSVTTYPDSGRYFGAYASAARKAELAFNGWISDYPAPSNFIRGVYGCSPYFCDRTLEKRIGRLVALEASDPAAASARWARLERQFVARAIAIPLVNPADVTFVSRRLGNYQRHPVFGVLLSQLWVR